jgi:hypothetical protein
MRENYRDKGSAPGGATAAMFGFEPFQIGKNSAALGVLRNEPFLIAKEQIGTPGFFLCI